MARIGLTCGCGWTFFIPSSTPGLDAACPSCSRPVPIPGRKPGMEIPLTPGEIAAKLQRRASAIRSLFLLGLAGAAAGGFLYWKSLRPVEEMTEETPHPRPPIVHRPPAPALEPLPPLPPTPPDRMPELRRRILENLWLVNMTSLVSECLRYRNLAREWAELQADVAVYENRIKADLRDLAGGGDTLPLDARLAAGDRIVGFTEKDLTSLKRVEAAQVLHRWMNAWRAGPGLTQVQILREDRKLTIYLQFPEATKELLMLLRHPSLQLDPQPDRDPRLAEPALPDQAGLSKAVETIAAEVIGQTEVFADVVVEMRQRTDSLRTTVVPVWPDESARGIAMIENPLTFRPGEMSAGASVEIGKWWNLLSREDRLGFAKYFGLWCAYMRTQPAKK
jgi:hypothetical protein